MGNLPQAVNETSQESHPALPDAWVERIFQRMENFYMSLWKDRFGTIPRERVKQAWAEELVGFSASEIKRGLESVRTMKFPPTLPEFMMACRPPTDAKTDWAEACEQMRVRLEGWGADRWSRPQVYWAAVSIGWYDLNGTAWDQIKARWIAALEKAKSDAIPGYMASLPAPGARTVTKVEAVDRVGELKSLVTGSSPMGTSKAGTKWAYLLMEREASGESLPHIACKTWREALGYDVDADAKKTFASLAKEIRG